MNVQAPPARKVFILYWRSAKKTHWYNAFVPEIEKLIENNDIETITKLKPLDFRFLNINRSDERNMDYQRHASLIDSYRPKKLRKLPLVVIDEGARYIYVGSTGELRHLENLLTELNEYYLQ